MSNIIHIPLLKITDDDGIISYHQLYLNMENKQFISNETLAIFERWFNCQKNCRYNFKDIIIYAASIDNLIEQIIRILRLTAFI